MQTRLLGRFSVAAGACAAVILAWNVAFAAGSEPGAAAGSATTAPASATPAAAPASPAAATAASANSKSGAGAAANSSDPATPPGADQHWGMLQTYCQKCH